MPDIAAARGHSTVISDLSTRSRLVLHRQLVENSVERLAVQVDAFALEYLEVWDRTMSVNLRGLFITNQAFGRRMLDRRSGVIVNISSMSGNLVVNTPQKQCAYNASKAAVTALTTSPPLRSRRPPTVTPPPKRRVSRSRNGDTLIRPCAPAEADEFGLNRRTFVGASVAIGGVVATSSLLAGCRDDEASAASAAE